MHMVFAKFGSCLVDFVTVLDAA